MIVALAGGVGGAKLVDGLASVLPAERLLVVVNTGDDFEHLGLSISPDIDTVLYTLAGLANPELGWGLANETWNVMAALESLGGETWFKLGDRDLATHLERTHRLRNGQTLSEVTAHLCRRFRIETRVVPMSDDAVRTRVHTREGVLPFQDYFVRRRCEPVVTAVDCDVDATARPSPLFDQALASAELEAVVICPSNPLLSIGPILAVPGVRARLASLRVPRIAVSPIVHGQAIKGPAAKMMRELGKDPSPLTVAEMYDGIVNGMIIDESDADYVRRLSDRGIVVTSADTVMKTSADRQRVARAVLHLVQTMRDAVATA